MYFQKNKTTMPQKFDLLSARNPDSPSAVGEVLHEYAWKSQNLVEMSEKLIFKFMLSEVPEVLRTGL